VFSHSIVGEWPNTRNNLAGYITRKKRTGALPQGNFTYLLVREQAATRVMKSWSERVIMGSRMKTTLASEGTLPVANGE
jgi:hypothetical protein